MKSGNSLQEKIINSYPRRPDGHTYLGTGVASVLIALIILTLACFAALTYLTAESKMEMSQKSETYCDNYYAAETTASDLLDMIASGKGAGAGTNGNKSSYDTDSGKILVTKADNYVSFAVPINKKQELQVEANVSDGAVDIITWSVEK